MQSDKQKKTPIIFREKMSLDSSMRANEKYTVEEDAAEICRDVCNKLFMPEPAYDHQRANQVINEICDATIQKLMHCSRLSRKYIAHCTIVQKNGAGLCTAAACSWNQDSDGCFAYKAENKTMICILTVFGVTM